MLKEKNPLLKLKVKKEKSFFLKILNNILQSLYALFELILDDPIENFWFEVSSLFICYVQIIIFIFNETFLPLWSKVTFIKEIFNIFQLIHFTILLKSNFSLYTIVVLIIIFLIFLLTIIIIVMLYRIGNNKRKIMWPILILRYSLPLLSFGFYGQIFLMFTTIFYCRKSESSTSPYLKCRPGHWFTKIKPIAGIALFFYFLIAFITNSLYYKPIFLRSDSDLLKKSNSLPDIIFLFIKMLIITIFILDKGVESEHWAILSFLVVVTGTNAYFTIFYKNRQNRVLLALNNFFSMILFSGFLILFIAKIFKFLNFDGSIILFFVSALLIILYTTFYKRSNKFISKDYKNINNEDEYLLYVSHFYNIIINKNNSRKYLNILQSIIHSIEENCIIQNCPLQKYLINLEKGFDCEYLLLQFCEKLFQYGISKFNGNIFLKNHYSIFLINEMNNKKKALINLESINYDVISLQTNYNIYRCRRIIENYSSPFINKNNSILNHRENIQQLKAHIKNFSFLYCQFLSFLLDSKIQKTNNLNKINNLGNQIVKLNKKIDNLFNCLINAKTDNFEVIKLYADFVENILKDEEKNKKCKDLKKLLHNTNCDDIHENDYSNFNFDYLKENSKFEYLIISSRNKDLGNIIDCSLNLCNIFGFTKFELIGSHINILIPEIFHHKHNILVDKTAEQNKLNFLEGLIQNTLYIPTFIQKEVFCITKTKFLVPINIKVYLVNSEGNELVYIAEITNNIFINKDLLNNNFINSTKYCILTDENFLIQSFTPNCLNFLNISYENINCNCSIINYIKQFKEDYITTLNDTTNISRKSLMKIAETILTDKNLKSSDKDLIKTNISKGKKYQIKTDIFNKNYNKRCKITWNSSQNNSSNITKGIKEVIKYSSIIMSNNENFLKSKLLDDNGIELYMETKKIILDKKLVGYYFFFTKIFGFQKTPYLKYKIVDKISSNTNLGLKKTTTKYECIFKSNKVFSNLKQKSKRKSLEKEFSRVKSKSKAKKSLVLDYEQKYNNETKSSSTNQMAEIKIDEDIIIDEKFVPINLINFAYDFKNNFFHISKNVNNNKLLNKALKKEANNIINVYAEIKTKKIKNKKSDISNSFESSNGAESDFESEEYFSSYSNTKSDKDENLKEEQKENNKKFITSENSIKRLENEKNNEKKNNNMIDSNYYKVNLSKIHLMIYDFYKDSIIEDKEKINISKIDKILKDLSKNDDINIGKDEKYPFIRLEKKIKNNEEKEREKTSNNYIQKDNVNKEEKLIEEKINDIIKNNKDEISIRNLKLSSLISYIILLIFCIVCLFLFLYFYKTFLDKFEIINIIAYIGYIENISIYYVKELALLSFNLTEIKGGKYTNFPAKSKDKYLTLIKSKLNELFLENQNYIENFSSYKVKFSKNTKELFKDAIMQTHFVSNYDNLDEFSNFLVQYNNEFYYFVLTSNQIYHNDENIYNYINNNFNKYRLIIQLLTGMLLNELTQSKPIIIKNSIIFITVIFIIFVVIYIFISKYIILSKKKYINYIKILCGINSNVLKLEIQKSLNLFNNLKDSDEKNDFELDEENNSIQNKLYLIDNKENKIKNGKISIADMIDLQEKNNNVLCSNISFFILFGFVLLLLYFYFISNLIYLLNIFRKSDNVSVFSYHFDNFHSKIIDMFNIYREYLYDKDFKILNYKSLEYLRIIEDEIYDTITISNNIIYSYIEKLIESHSELIQDINLNFCSINITDYFDSYENCTELFKYFYKYDFFFLTNYFLEEIKIGKNLVKYKDLNENIVGNLNNNNITNLIEEYQNEKKKNNNTEFRLSLFNNETIHSKLNLVFINQILPNLKISRNSVFKYLPLVGKEHFFIELSIIYFIILSFIFVVSFILINKILNVQINNAKNMLSIIPISVLTSQNNNNYINDLFVNK